MRHLKIPARMNLLPKNLRYAARMLFKSPGFTAVAVLALGLGIGANTAIFSLADVLLYHPLELPDLDRVVILAHALCAGRFASDPHILNRTIQMEGQGYRVVGVMPKDFRYPPGVDLWIPLAMDASERGQPSAMSLDVVGRLHEGVSVAQADSELAALAERISELDPEAHRHRTVRVELLRAYVSGNLVEDFIVMLMGSVAFVLLIACSNVANLQFARVSLRSKEMAI